MSLQIAQLATIDTAQLVSSPVSNISDLDIEHHMMLAEIDRPILPVAALYT